jgi:phage baseplate assembly protein W
LFAHPDYGNLIWDLLSENVNNAWAGKAETAIRECLNQEPRISVDSIQISIYPEARRVVADIYYQVKDVPGVENLVWSVAT